MPKTLTLPESFFNEAYDSIMDMNELVKMLHEHVLLETRYGDQKIPPGHDIVLDTISDMLSGMMDDFDLSVLRRRVKKMKYDLRRIIMNNLMPTLSIVKGHPVVSSLSIAEHFGKRHDDVVRDIKGLEIPEEFNALNFEAVDEFDCSVFRRRVKKNEIRYEENNHG